MASMELSAPGLDLIDRWEGEPGTGSFSPRLHDDVAGFPTVGNGLRLTARRATEGAIFLAGSPSR